MNFNKERRNCFKWTLFLCLPVFHKVFRNIKFLISNCLLNSKISQLETLKLLDVLVSIELVEFCDAINIKGVWVFRYFGNVKGTLSFEL